MSDVLTAAIIHQSKRLDTGLAARCPSGWRQPWNAESDSPFRLDPPVRDHADSFGRRQGLKSGLDFSIGLIRHSPRGWAQRRISRGLGPWTPRSVRVCPPEILNIEPER